MFPSWIFLCFRQGKNSAKDVWRKLLQNCPSWKMWNHLKCHYQFCGGTFFLKRTCEFLVLIIFSWMQKHVTNLQQWRVNDPYRSFWLLATAYMYPCSFLGKGWQRNFWELKLPRLWNADVKRGSKPFIQLVDGTEAFPAKLYAFKQHHKAFSIEDTILFLFLSPFVNPD